MSHSQKVKVAGFLLLAVMTIGVLWLSPLSSLGANRSEAHAASLTFHQYADGPYTVKNNTIVGADGTPYLFHGVGLDSLEFLCNGDGLLDSAHLAFIGPGNSGPGGTYWYANSVRLPLSEGFWLRGDAAQGCTAAQYQARVKSVVDSLTAKKMNVIVDLQWTDAGGQSANGGAGWESPDNDSLTFWTQVPPIYKSYSNVLFELYNEPHMPSWTCWASGCTITNDTTCCKQSLTYQGVGMQALVNAVRNAGANNLAVVGGMDWGYDLSQLSTYAIKGSNIVYDTHPYPYPNKQPSNWDTFFGNESATYPVISLENGEYDCGTGYMGQLLNYFDAHGIGWMGWSWYNGGSSAQGCGYPQLIADSHGTPSTNTGTLIYQHMLSYAGQSPISPATGKVNSNWYFAEGRVGKGFTEWLTIGNPTQTACSVSVKYLYVPDGGSSATKTISFTVQAFQRATRSVDSDLGTSPGGSGINDSAIVTTSGCSGVVAERPMYFNALGVNSGDDTMGATHTGTTFYFADVAIGSGYSTFISILNPSTASATVTANYFASGQSLGTQQVTVQPGTRGTMTPGTGSGTQLHLPSRVAVTLSSTQPVVIERPTYFHGINAANAGTNSGAADIMGVQSMARDWLFAEGYIGANFQENFVIANLDTTAATVTINLEYTTGATKAITVSVGSHSQLIWNVNANAANGPSTTLSAEITSSGGQIVVEREMFFNYHNSIGGTDVLGQVGPAAFNSYSFAEGFTLPGAYDEWLTLQNPTGNNETITITTSNMVGTIFTTQVNVAAHSRGTVSMNQIVSQYMYHSPDGANGYAISMGLSSNGVFVAERPMYWNASRTEGGSDALGYAGG